MPLQVTAIVNCKKHILANKFYIYFINILIKKLNTEKVNELS